MLTQVSTALPARAQDEVDGYTLWRRRTIDACQRLPTLAEVAAIEGNGGEVPSSFDATIEACLMTEEFGELIGLWVQDFVMATAGAPVAQTHQIIQLSHAYESSTVYYWTTRSNYNWAADCLEGVTLTSSNIDTYLDRAYEPYWQDVSGASIETDPESGRRFVYVCRQSGTFAEVSGSSCQTAEADQFSSASLADTRTQGCYLDTDGTTWRRKVCDPYSSTSAANYAPCGCGENMRWCFPNSLTTASGANDSSANFSLLGEELIDESRKLAEYIVNNDEPFTDIFNAGYRYRTARLQLFYDLLERYYQDSAGMDTYDCTRVVDVGQSDETACAGPYVSYTDDATWQVIGISLDDDGNGDGDRDGDGDADLDYYTGGILTTYGFLRRFTTEANVAGRVYSFLTCEDVSWRPVSYAAHYTGTSTEATDADYWTIDLYEEDQPFSTLFRTTATLEPFNGGHDSECAGCHMIVNPLAAFRNRWDTTPRYNTAGPLALTDADGIFRGQSGTDLSGLGDILAEDPVVQRCIVNRHVELLTGHQLDLDSSELDTFHEAFMANRSIRDLYSTILSSELYARPE